MDFIEFDFELPKRLIANEPAVPRDSSRLLVYDASLDALDESGFSKIGNFLPSDCVLVFNRTKVYKARLIFDNKELFFLKDLTGGVFNVMVRPGKYFDVSSTVDLPGGFQAKVLNVNKNGTRNIFIGEDFKLFDYLREYGLTPLPPYINLGEKDPNLFESQYQTIYADKVGSVAAPTAGLHFTRDLLDNLSDSGVDFEFVHLDVGLGTFAPLREENLESGKLHEEFFEISPSTAEFLNYAVKNNRKIIAVGTTSLRVLQSSYDFDAGIFVPNASSTDIFIRPGFKDFVVDGLITNFHLPRSSLFMLVCAFVGTDNAKRVYKYAIDNKFRFYSFGDACLFLR